MFSSNENYRKKLLSTKTNNFCSKSIAVSLFIQLAFVCCGKGCVFFMVTASHPTLKLLHGKI